MALSLEFKLKFLKIFLCRKAGINDIELLSSVLRWYVEKSKISRENLSERFALNNV